AGGRVPGGRAHQPADLLAVGVAQVLQLLGALLDLLALGLQGLQRGGVEGEATGGQAFGQSGGLVAEQRGIEHDGHGLGRGCHYPRSGPRRLAAAVPESGPAPYPREPMAASARSLTDLPRRVPHGRWAVVGYAFVLGLLL